MQRNLQVERAALTGEVLPQLLDRISSNCLVQLTQCCLAGPVGLVVEVQTAQHTMVIHHEREWTDGRIDLTMLHGFSVCLMIRYRTWCCPGG